jgi:hypothetical protein
MLHRGEQLVEISSDIDVSTVVELTAMLLPVAAWFCASRESGSDDYNFAKSPSSAARSNPSTVLPLAWKKSSLSTA